MSRRAILAAVAASLLMIAGCSSEEPTSNPPSEQPTASPSAPTPGQERPGTGTAEETSVDLPPQAPLGAEGCIDVTGANLNLAVADNAEEARAAADVFARFGPPDSVTEALEHFVETGGVKSDDPQFDEYNARIDAWVKAVCPL